MVARAGAIAVSRKFHEPPRLATTVSLAFHARFTRYQRHGARCPRLDQRATMRQHLTVATPSRTQMHPTLSHAIPRRHRFTTPQKPHDSNGSVSNSEILSRELHATFAELHPLWSITPDQWALHPIRTGAMLTDRVHGLISDKLRRGYTSGAARPPPTGPTLRTISLTRGRSHGPHRRIVGIKPQLRLFLSGVTPLRGHYTGSEMVQCSLTGVMLPNWCRAARHGSADILLEQLWSKSSRA